MLHVPVPAYRPTALLWLMRFHSTIATVYCTQDNTPPETNFRAGFPPQIRGVHTTKMAALGRPRQHFSIARPVARRFLALPVVNRSSASKSARGAVLPYYYTNMNSIKIHKIMYDPCDTVRRHCFFFFFFLVAWFGLGPESDDAQREECLCTLARVRHNGFTHSDGPSVSA